MEKLQIRQIAPTDNPALARIIRDVLTEHGANIAGTVFTDPTTDHLYELYQRPGARYFVAEQDGVVAGGAGIHPLDGGEAHVCELQKMYILPQYRGQGIAGRLLKECFAYAVESGYTQCYLETLPQLSTARGLYERLGFRYLDGPMGNTGHFGCDYWMLKDLV